MRFEFATAIWILFGPGVVKEVGPVALASLFGGLALANAGLGAVHGCAAPLEGLFSAPHGTICARLLPPVMAANVGALRARAADSPALERYTEIARILTGRSDAAIPDGIEWVRSLCKDLKIPGLSRYGLTEAGIPDVVAEARRASSRQGNPIALRDEELANLLRQVL
jgi:alcohol dehydrogenase class IV